MERTYAMIKPDGVQRNLVGEIVRRIEAKGYKIVAMKMLQLTKEMAEEHYREHVGKPFYPGLVSYITSGPVIAMVLEGKNVVKGMRTLMGATNPADALPGTIRGDFGLDVGRNVIHGADSVESAAREMAIYFKPEELLSYSKAVEGWLYE
ncbi:nucleoside-diphosphate kinase [Zhaonella formicivorans]|uniref:nucleoside-diphosphate kinase n=1 Tax=Zhaonella formicivorans TaxID=2528593 RepID=UPI0010DFB572|nr:nucleoside-diphosphate kinase [Zhaonella formicivorans]